MAILIKMKLDAHELVLYEYFYFSQLSCLSVWAVNVVVLSVRS